MKILPMVRASVDGTRVGSTSRTVSTELSLFLIIFRKSSSALMADVVVVDEGVREPSKADPEPLDELGFRRCRVDFTSDSGIRIRGEEARDVLNSL